MKRFITTGLSVLMLTALVMPGAKAENTPTPQNQDAPTTETTAPQPTVKPTKVQAIKVEVSTQDNKDETLSERDRITLERRFQRILPPDAVNSPQTPSAF
ncbi:MAG: hypothetical protein IGS48_05270 [Oscillatoriales cyanobacterium C42_A2020_001]|nr:hypothetical protein [Leptolyngbyaceae cyanobacterium C42_A2020_001]